MVDWDADAVATERDPPFCDSLRLLAAINPCASVGKNTRNIGDFTRWEDHDAYAKSFARLLRDLKASEAKKA